MMDSLADLDQEAADLIRRYHARGNFACLLRRSGPDVRAISPQIGAPNLCEWLDKVREAIFNGPAVVRER